jgi:hypothetical protein
MKVTSFTFENWITSLNEKRNASKLSEFQPFLPGFLERTSGDTSFVCPSARPHSDQGERKHYVTDQI